MIALIIAALARDADVEQLRQFAPQYLTLEAAREHLIAARLASGEFRVDPATLLAIAYNESRFIPTASGREHDGTMSCGVTGVQHGQACIAADMTILRGYQRGAQALRGWLDAAAQPRHPSLIECRKRSTIWQCAMMGYAGGWRALDICNARDHANCRYPDVVLRRATTIRGGAP